MLQPVDRMPTAPPIPPITVAGVGTQQAGRSGGYVFHPDEIDTVIKQWEDLLDETMDDHREAQAVANVQAPGLEFASTDYADVAGRSGEMLLDQITRTRDYVIEYIKRLKAAKEATLRQDENTATELDAASGGIV